MKLRKYEIHIFELRNEEINVKKILAVVNATYAFAKRKPEKNQACRDSNPDLCDTGISMLYASIAAPRPPAPLSFSI